MKRMFLYFFITLSFCVFSQNIQQNQNSYLQNEKNYSLDEFIVLLRSEAINRADFNSTRTDKSVIGIQSFDELSKDSNVVSVELCFNKQFKFPRKAKTSKLDRYVIVKLSDNADLELIMKQYENLSEVELVEPNYTVKAHTTPNDPLYSEQWGLKNTSNAKEFGTSNLVGTPGSDINVEPAWNLHTGVSNPVTIAILDTGVDYNHPEFSGRMLPGFDFMNNNNDPMDEDYDGHGTSCAGIAAAAGNNGIGVAGVNWGADILPVKVLDNNSGTSTAVANGLIFAVDNGADVISMSLGSSSPSTLIENAALYAYNADVLVFASRGNDNNTFDNYPSSYSTVISVGGLSPCDTRKTPNSCDGENWWGASYGGGPDKMDFVAPAARITTTDITGFGGYSSNEYTDSFNGTSSACPFAAGVGALIRSYNPSLNVDEIRNIMRTTAVDIQAVGYDDETGYGKIDAEAALLAAIPYDFWFETQDVADFDTCNSSDIATIDFDFFRLPTAGNEAVTLSLLGAPSGLMSLFTPQTITNQTTFNLSLSGISSLSAGSYNFTISGQSTSFTYDLPVTLNVFDALTQNVNLIFPADNQNSIGIPFEFQWQTINNANAYQIQIATDIGFTNIVEDSTIFEAQYTSTNVTAGNQYYWRVKPINACGEGSFSSAFGFISACDNTATLGLNFATTSELNLDIMNSNASAWEIEAVPTGTPPTGIGSLFTSTSPNFTNLISDTCYDFYIRSDCAIGFSNWSGPYQFCTTPDYCNGDLFYDSGGPNGNYSNGEFNITTIYPSAGSNTVTVDFTSFQTEGCCDYLQIFDGDDTNAPLIGQYQGFNNSPGSVSSSNASGALTFLFFSDGSVTDSGWEAVVTCAFVSCPDPNNLDVTNLTQTSADITWDPGSTETQWEIEYGVTGFAQGSGTIIQANTNSYTLTGLTHNTTYDAYIRANCGTNPGDDDSNWIGPLTFTTLDLYPPGNLVAEITDQINGTVELNWESTASVVGEWIINLSFNCTGIDDVSTPIIFYDDFTFEVPSESSSGTWVLTGNQIVFTFDNGFEYTGTVQGNYMSGTNAAGGCWYADKVSSGDTMLSMDFVVPEVLSNGVSATNPGAVYTHTFSSPGSNTSVLSYNVYKDNVNIASTTNTNYTDNLAAFGTYEYYITAVYAGGESIPSNTELVVWSSCPTPSNLSVSNITGSNAEISWDVGGTETQWEMEYDVTGFVQGSGTLVQTNTNPSTITGLNPLTTYDIYLRANCGPNPGDDDSSWIGPLSFTTLCATFTAPYTEDFETFTVSSSAFIEENCWTSVSGSYYWEVADIGDTSSSGTGPAPGVSTGNYMFTEASSGNTGDITELTSPQIDLSNLAIPSLQFDYHMYGGDMGTLEVLVNGTDNVFTVSGQQNFENDPFLSQIIDLTAYTSQTIFVVFRGIRGFGFQSDIAIDNISFLEMPSCPDPNNLIVSGITESSVDISWDAGGTETQWEIEYGLTGFVQGNGTIEQTNTNPFTLTGLNTLTTYDIYLRANCGPNPGDDDSNWIGPVSFTTLPDYCSGDLFYDSGGPNGNYSNGEFNTTTIYPSAGFNTVTVDFTSFQTESCCDYLQIFDGDDTNAPLIGQYQGVNSPGSVSSSNASGALTFLFSSDGSVTGSGWEAVVTCSSISCPDPNNLNVTNLTQTSAEISWDVGGTETQWEMEYDVAGFVQGSGTLVQTNTNPSTITGLNPLTTYDIYLRANCGPNPGDDDSNWIGPVTFTTLDLYPPGNLVAEITDDINGTVELNWGLTSSIVGEWIINLSVNCTGVNDVSAPIIFYDDFTFEVPSESSFGTWVLTGNQIVFTFDGNGFQYTGTVQGNYMSGTNAAGGCWYADQISTGTDDSVTMNFMVSNMSISGEMTSSPNQVYTHTFNQAIFGNTVSNFNVYRDNIVIASTTATTYTDALPAYGTYTYYITAVYNGNESTASNTEVVVWSSCTSPSNLAVTNVSGNSADLSWLAGSTETEWEIEYGFAGFTQGSGTTVPTTTNPYTLAGLSPETAYDVYLRAICSTNSVDNSAWIGPVSFTTTCAVYLAPFYEHFANTTIPDCWDEYGGENWNFSLGADYDAASAGDHTSGQNTNYAWIDASAPNGAQHISNLKTMDIDVSSLSTPTLQFSVFSVNTDDFTYNTLSVTVSNSANETLSVLTLQGSTNNWTTYTIDLSSITSNSNIISVEFSIEENSPGIPYFNDILIDDVIIDDSSVLGVEDFDSDALSYYPNPLSDILHVSYSKEIDKVEIYNVLGQKLKTINTRNRNLEIDMSLFNAGTYILNIYSESSQQVIKVIKI